jgi:hypothetical protein
VLFSRTRFRLGPLLAVAAVTAAVLTFPSTSPMFGRSNHPVQLASSALPSSPQSTAVRLLGRNMAAVGWSAATNQIVYDRRGSDHLWDAYTANPDGSNEKCLTCNLNVPGPGTGGQRGAYSVSPDGRYVLVSIEGKHTGEPYGMENEAPGKGSNNYIWLMRIDGSAAWQLTHEAQDGDLGTMWADFDRTGNRIVWAQLTGMATPLAAFGTWKVEVASISWSNGVPVLTNIVTRLPQAGKFYEPYAFTPDGSGILMSSDYSMPSAYFSQIWIMTIATGAMNRISPADTPHDLISQLAPFVNYNEFAQYTPDNSLIVFGRTRGDGGGIDYWTIRPDGSDPHRLTFTGESWSSEGLGYGNFGGFAFDPNNPNRIFAGHCLDPLCANIDSYYIDTAVGGLTASYYTDRGFSHLLGQRVENPSDGLQIDPVPMPGLPTSQFSVRWAGTLTAPASGTYTFSTRTDPWSALAISIDGKTLPATQQLLTPGETSTVNLTAGRHNVSLSYVNGGAQGYEQVLWTVPGAAAATPIPMSALAAH